MNTGEDAAMRWPVIGHDWAVAFLRRSLAHGRNRHAYLISGSPALGKMTLALTFAQALNCEAESPAGRPCLACRACKAIGRGHDPDLIVAAAEDGAPLKIDAIREAARLLALKPYSARYRIAVLDDVHMVAPLAQDALLKTLEEPPGHAVLLLLAAGVERVLPTIRSRAQHLPLRPAPLELIKRQLIGRGCEEERADLLARLSGGRVGWALSASADDALLVFRDEMLDILSRVLDGARLRRMQESDKLSRRAGKDKALLRRALEIWQSYWRDVLLQCYESPVKPCNSDRQAQIRALAARLEPAAALVALAATDRTLGALSTNANLRLALDALFLDYPGLE
ncbi:MAG: DNA polymerase III subunit [Chloroflexi bacterium]|nr:DNA polymerase III subunit [Chloroflexota bacterium]